MGSSSTEIPQWIRRFSDMIAKNDPELLYIHLDDEALNDACAKILGAAIGQTTFLRECYLYQNEIGPLGAKYLAEALIKNSCITVLYMSANNIGNEGATAFGKMLRRNHTLKEIFLRGNNIGNVGAIGLAQGLEHNQSVETLDLRNNNISSVKAARALGSMLRHNTNLRFLWLEGNAMGGDEGVREFITNGLEHNYHLEGLDGLHTQDPRLQIKLAYYTGLNVVGRRLLKQEVPTAVWAHVLARAKSKPAQLYYFAKAKPDLFQYGSIDTATIKSRTRKRRRRQYR